MATPQSPVHQHVYALTCNISFKYRLYSLQVCFLQERNSSWEDQASKQIFYLLENMLIAIEMLIIALSYISASVLRLSEGADACGGDLAQLGRPAVPGPGALQG